VINACLKLGAERIVLRQSALEKFSEVLPTQALPAFYQLKRQIESYRGLKHDRKE
jgi:hypothetical protein